MRSDYHIPWELYKKRKAKRWPRRRPGTIVAQPDNDNVAEENTEAHTVRATPTRADPEGMLFDDTSPELDPNVVAEIERRIDELPLP